MRTTARHGGQRNEWTREMLQRGAPDVVLGTNSPRWACHPIRCTVCTRDPCTRLRSWRVVTAPRPLCLATGGQAELLDRHARTYGCSISSPIRPSEPSVFSSAQASQYKLYDPNAPAEPDPEPEPE